MTEDSKRMQAPRQLPILGASACVLRPGEVLLIQRGKPPGQGQWSLPGGHVEWGETAQQAAVRELLEETGLQADLSHLVGLHDIIRTDNHGAVHTHYAIACYAGWYSTGDAVAGSDAMACQWVRFENLQTFDLAESITLTIASARKMLRL